MTVNSDDIKNAARSFEAIKFSLTHKRDGYHLSLVVQPEDMDRDIFTDLIGQRYMVAMVALDDDELPKGSYHRVKLSRAFVSAHQLPKLEEFWPYLEDMPSTIGRVTNEEEATDALYRLLGIKSRKELKDNDQAQEAMLGIIGDFEEWHRRNTGTSKNT